MEILDEKILDMSGKTVRMYIPSNPNGDNNAMVISHRDAAKSHSIVLNKEGVTSMLKFLNKAKNILQ